MKNLALLVALLLTPAVASAAASTMTYSDLKTTQAVATCPAASGVAACTLDCTNSPIAISCSDTDTCAITLSETHSYFQPLVNQTATAFLENDECVVVNRGSNAITFAASSGVQELDATVTLPQYGVQRFVYSNARWTGIKPTGSTIPGNVTVTGDLTVTGGDVIGVVAGIDLGEATANTHTLTRTTSGTVTLTAADDDATAALTVLPGGAAAMVLGGASMTSLTVTTDGTGTGEVVLPAGSIGVPELARPFQTRFRICGDATTVNNNTVYYGPDITVVSSSTVGTVKCDTTQAGNTTEATADTPVFDGIAYGVTGMTCWTDNPGATITYTLRNNAAATVPSVTCSTATGAARLCVANIQTTTDIAANNPVAIAVASTSDVGTVHFICEVGVVF